jgi:hypothetical protein
VHQRLLLYDSADNNPNRLANIEKAPKKPTLAAEFRGFITSCTSSLRGKIADEKKPAAAGFFLTKP